MKRDVFQAVADPTRRAIPILIASQALISNAWAEHVKSTRQAVSKHGNALAECGLGKQKKVEREIYNHFNPLKIIRNRPMVNPI